MTEGYNTIILNIAILLQILGMLLIAYSDHYLPRRDRSVVMVIGFLTLSLLLQNQLDHALGAGLIDAGPRVALYRTLVSVYGYAIRPVIIMLFIKLNKPDRRYRGLWILTGINAAVYLTAFFSPIAVSFAEDGGFRRGPLGITVFIISFIQIIYMLIPLVADIKNKERVDNLIPVVLAILIIAAVVTDIALGISLPVSFLTVAMSISCVFYYIWLHLRFVRDHEEAMQAEQRIQLMMSQIQPHFLYNTLSTIQALCSKDPDQAGKTVEMFANYLRQNLSAIGQTDLIPFNKELEHTRIYTEIEKLMYPSLNLEYDIQDTNFLMPALTLQPLVENAIRHGIRGKKDGVVRISTRRVGEFHEIEIRDNGKGFDMKAAPTGKGTHIGMKNVKERLEKMCDGVMDIASEPGKGTDIVITIPYVYYIEQEK